MEQRSSVGMWSGMTGWVCLVFNSLSVLLQSRALSGTVVESTSGSVFSARGLSQRATVDFRSLFLVLTQAVVFLVEFFAVDSRSFAPTMLSFTPFLSVQIVETGPRVPWHVHRINVNWNLVNFTSSSCLIVGLI